MQFGALRRGSTVPRGRNGAGEVRKSRLQVAEVPSASPRWRKDGYFCLIPAVLRQISLSLPSNKTENTRMMNQNGGGFLEQIPTVTKNLIIINALCWLASLVMPRVGVDLVDWMGLHFPLASDFYLYQLVTYMFMHADFSHIFFNMFAVYMFGRVLESVWGPKRFLIYYVVTGIGAGIIQELTWMIDLRDVLSAPQEMVNIGGGQILNKPEFYNLFVTIGASGAVFGILLAFGMMFPNVPLYLMFIPIPIKAKYFVLLYGLIELTMGVASFRGDSVAHFAHLGGMLFGYLLIRYWRKKGIRDGRYY